MRISVYRPQDGQMSVMVEAAIGSGKPPVVLRGVTRENFVKEVLPVAEAQRGRRVTPRPTSPA